MTDEPTSPGAFAERQHRGDAALPRCRPPKPPGRPAVLRCPPGATDCHVHVYGPAATYPPVRTRSFDVPDALPAALRATLRSLGLERAVLVQPSTYGSDDTRQFDAASELGIPARVVAALRGNVGRREVATMHRCGVRGLRLTLRAESLDLPRAIAPLVAELGWHLDCFVPPTAGPSLLARHEAALRALPCAIVIEHVGSIRPELGLEQPGFLTMLRLLAGGRCWIKLSAAYRTSSAPPPFVDFVPYVRRLVAERPDRLVWGSDWPHVAFDGTMPDDADLLDQLLTWIPGPQERSAILVDNATALYDF